jgi:hypothetical protein
VKKFISITGLIIVGLLSGCSDNNAVKSNLKESEGEVSFKGASAQSGGSQEGVWGFCNDKKADVSLAEDSCQLIDSSIWHLADGELTALEVKNTETEDCTTTCFKLNNEVLNTKVIAKGSYTLDENGYKFTITDSSDENKFPICTVSWNFGNKLADDLIEWKFNNVDCELPEINYTAWARKYKGQVN